MTLKNPLKELPPHGERRLTVHFFILLLLAVIAFCASHCTVSRKPKDPCKERRGMSGYGYGWIKNGNTKEVFILDSTGGIVTTFIDGTGMMHSKQTF